MKFLILLSTFIFSSYTFADYQYKHFKLTPKLKNKIQKENKGKTDIAPILQKVWDKIKEEGLKQANKLTEEIIDYNEDFSLGEYNTPDMNWNMGAEGEFGLVLGRRVDPTLNNDDWRVHDQLEVIIEAKSFLKSMRDSGDIEISDKNLNLFAGVKFSRKYTFDHFAKSYKDGLLADWKKLFLGFNYFRDTNYMDLLDGEIVKMDDHLSANVRFSVNTPSMYFMSGFGRGSIYYSKMNSLSYHRPLPENRYGELDALRLSKQVTKLTGASAQIGLQADFYNLLTITLLGSEYKVDYTKTSVTNMTFGEEDLDLIRNNFELQNAIDKVNRGKNPRSIEILDQYITSTEEGNRVTEELDLFALIWGKHMGTSTDELYFDTDQGEHYFYRHNEERVSLTRSWWDALFRSKNVSKFVTREIENMVFEYETNNPDIPFEEVNLELPANISFRISKEYRTKKDKKSYNKKALSLIKYFESVEGGIVDGLKDGRLKGPLTLDLHAQVGKDGIAHLVTADHWELDEAFEQICNGKAIEPGSDIKKSVKKCLSKLNNYYTTIESAYSFSKTINLYNLKKFLQVVSKNAKSFKSLEKLFGQENVQMYGFLKSKTKDKKNFKTFFKDGENQGYGVIKDFVRSIE